MNEVNGWTEILEDAKRRGKRVSILVNGSFKPYTGLVLKITTFMVVLVNEYSSEYVALKDIKAVRVFD